jgi:hypothetical protein
VGPGGVTPAEVLLDAVVPVAFVVLLIMLEEDSVGVDEVELLLIRDTDVLVLLLLVVLLLGTVKLV